MTRTTPVPTPAPRLRVLVVIALGIWFGAYCPHPAEGPGSSHHNVSVTLTPPSLAAGHSPTAPATGVDGDRHGDHSHAPDALCRPMETQSARLVRAAQGLPNEVLCGQPLAIRAMPLGIVVPATPAMPAAWAVHAPSRLGVLRH
jgi:hypothetical protein